MGRVMLIARQFPPTPGGIQSFMYEVYSRMGNGVVVIAHNDIDSAAFDRQQPFSIYRTPSFLRFLRGEKAPLLPMLMVVLRGLLSSNISQVHCDQAKTGFLAYVLKRLFGKPYVVWAHGLEVRNNTWTSLKRLVYRNAAVVIANGLQTKRLLMGLGVPPETIAVIRPGVNIHHFNTDIDSSHVIQRHGLRGKKVILTVGRMDIMAGHKRFDKVIRALPLVLEKIPDAVYLIAGAGNDEARVRDLTKEMGIASSIVFAGNVPREELPLYYGACHLFVTPSPEIHLTFLEASACGKPVVAGLSQAEDGASEVIEDNVTGLLVPPDDASAIARAIILVLGDEDLAQELGAQGRRMVEERFNWDIIAEKVREVSLNLANYRSAPHPFQ